MTPYNHTNTDTEKTMTGSPRSRNSSHDVHVRIVATSFPEWHAAMSGNSTYQRIACNGWWSYISFEEYERFYAVAREAPGYNKNAGERPFYAA